MITVSTRMMKLYCWMPDSPSRTILLSAGMTGVISCSTMEAEM